MILTVESFGIVDKTEVDVFLEFPSFLCDPVNVGNLISGSSSFSKPSLDIWKFLVHMIWKPVCLQGCFSSVQPFVTLWTVAQQVSLFMGFSRQEYWIGLPFPTPGDLPSSGIDPMSLTSATWQA